MSMMTFPNAKINLGLQVIGRRADGYHDLQTIFVPIPLQDVLELRPLNFYDKRYELVGPGLDCLCAADDNLVVRVFRSLQDEFNLPPQTIHLFKRIPTGAGLGGGSADAAFMMRLLNEQFSLGLSGEDMQERLSSFGADCPFFVQNTPCYATGIGTALQPIKLDLKDYWLLLVKPPLSVSTREAYSNISPRPAQVDLREAVKQPISEWRNLIHNDFEDSVFPAYPSIRAIKDTLYQMNALYASMSGSGSAVFAIMKHEWPDADDIFPDCFVFQHRWKLYNPTFN